MNFIQIMCLEIKSSQLNFKNPSQVLHTFSRTYDFCASLVAGLLLSSTLLTQPRALAHTLAVVLGLGKQPCIRLHMWHIARADSEVKQEGKKRGNSQAHEHLKCCDKAQASCARRIGLQCPADVRRTSSCLAY